MFAKNKFLKISKINLNFSKNFYKFNIFEFSKTSSIKNTPKISDKKSEIPLSVEMLELRREQNEKFKKMRQDRSKLNEKLEKVPRVNIYQYKSTGQIKMFYFTNKEIIVNDPLNVDQMVSIFDNFIKTARYQDRLEIDKIISENLVHELIHYIEKSVDHMSLKSLLKILCLNVHKENKKMVEVLNNFSITLLKKFDFNKILSGEYLKEQNNLNSVEKVTTKNIIDLFLFLTKMQKYVNIYREDLEKINKFFNFKSKLLNEFLNENYKINFKISNFSTEDLMSLIWIMNKSKLRQIDLFNKITNEMMHPKKIEYLRLRGTILTLWTISQMNIINKNLINTCLETLNKKYKENFVEEMNQLESFYIFNLFEFFSSGKYEINSTIQINLRTLFENYLLKIEKEKIPKNLYLTEVLTALQYFILVDLNLEKIDFILDQINENFEFLQIKSHVELIKIYEIVLNKNVSGDNNYKFDTIKNRMTNLFLKTINKINNKREEINAKDYLSICKNLFDILNLGENINLGIKNNYKDVQNLFLSLFSESNINFVIEDLNLTQDFIKMLNFVYLYDKNIIRKLLEVGEKEINFVMMKLFSNLKVESENEELILDDDSDLENENYSQNLSKNNNLENNLNDQKCINLLFMIFSLNNTDKNLLFNVDKIYLENLINHFINIDKHTKKEFTLHEKLVYNLIANKIENKNKYFIDISERDLKINNIFKHQHYIDTLIETSKEYKKTLFIETNKILDRKFLLDIHIPSLKLCLIIDINSGRLLNLPKKVNLYESDNLIYNDLIKHIKEKHDLDLYIIPDYILEDHIYARDYDQNTLLRQIIKTSFQL